MLPFSTLFTLHFPFLSSRSFFFYPDLKVLLILFFLFRVLTIAPLLYFFPFLFSLFFRCWFPSFPLYFPFLFPSPFSTLNIILLSMVPSFHIFFTFPSLSPFPFFLSEYFYILNCSFISLLIIYSALLLLFFYTF